MGKIWKNMGKIWKNMGKIWKNIWERYMYPLVNVYITMENEHFEWENPVISMALF